MPRILYIHGFKSTGNALKAQILKKKFDDILSPTMPISPKEAVLFLEEVIRKNEIDLIIGSSLGGFYAFVMHKKFGTKVLLINPSLKPWESLKNQVGIHERFVSDDTFEWKTEHNEELQQISNEISKLPINESKLNFFISNDDELLDHSQIPILFKNSNIQFFDKAGHQFIAFTRTIKDIKEILRTSPF